MNRIVLNVLNPIKPITIPIIWVLVLFSAANLCAQLNAANQDSLQVSFTLSELLSQTEELNKQVNKTITQLQDTTALHNFKTETLALSNTVKKAQEESDLFLQSTHRGWLVQNLLVKWSRENDNSQKLNDRLSEAIQKAENELQKTKELRATWISTRADILKSELGTSLKKPIAELLERLRTEEKLLQQQIQDYLRLQESISANRLIIASSIEELRAMISHDLSGYFNRDETFLWKRVHEEVEIPLEFQLRQSYQFASQDIGEYIKANIGLIVLLTGAGVALFLITLSVNKKINREKPEVASTQSESRVIHFAGTYSYTITIILALSLLENRPLLFTELLLLMFSVSLIVLVISQGKGIVRYITAILLLVYWSNKLTDFLIFDNHLSNYIDLFNTVLTTIFLSALYKNRKSFRQQFPQVFGFLQQSLLPLLLVFAFLSLILHLVGFTSLAHLLINGTISFLYLAPVILISSVITRDLLRAFEQTALVKNSMLAQKYYYVLFAGIKAFALLLLFISFINGFSLRPSFNTFVQNAWEFGGQFGAFNITVGDVLEFIFILLISWLISVIVAVLLEGELLSRLNMRRGVAMAIGVIARYFIIVLGFLLAVASTGFDLTKISILAGALGVGIGFGLQNLVANFIAGLILIFERPFVVNDVIESDQVEGTVTQIGIRSSKIITYDGAEVIIPNSNLISNQVSNWTLSNASRRQLIIVRTSMQADPDEVIKILYQIVNHHETTLDIPEPFVLFDGQLEQSLQFKLYYWVASDLFKTRSELNLQIYRELKTMGVELPIPVHSIQSKQEIRIEKT